MGGHTAVLARVIVASLLINRLGPLPRIKYVFQMPLRTALGIGLVIDRAASHAGKRKSRPLCCWTSSDQLSPHSPFDVDADRRAAIAIVKLEYERGSGIDARLAPMLWVVLRADRLNVVILLAAYRA
jgi:hypothetical protein